MAYDVWLATTHIDFGAARGFNLGDRVPDSIVTAHGLLALGHVVKVTLPGNPGETAKAFNPATQRELDAAVVALREEIAAGGGAAVPAASTTFSGRVELATATETTTGTDAVRAVTPAGLKAVRDALPTDPALRAAFLPRWAPNTAYAQGDTVLSPAGATVSANAAFTSGTTYNASNWTVTSGGTVPDATNLAKGKVALLGELAGAASAPVLRTKARNERRRIPTLTRYPDAKVGTLASIGLDTIYVPWIVRVPDSVFATYPAGGRWRVYTSTDHDTGDGGVAIGVCMTDDIETPANWSWLRNSGSPVMFKDGSNRQTETPCVVWNPITALFHMYYQVAVGTTQTTRVATSANGVTGWTIVGDAIANLPSNVAGWNHTGYCRVYYLDGIWAAWHLQGSGTAVSAYGWSWSLDGFKWITDRRRVGAAVHLTDGVLRLGISSLVDFRGELWAVGTQSEYTSGAASSSVSNVWAAPISRESDLRTLKGRPQFISPSDTTAIGIPTAWAEHPDGRLFGAYRLDGATGSLALAVLS